MPARLAVYEDLIPILDRARLADGKCSLEQLCLECLTTNTIASHLLHVVIYFVDYAVVPGESDIEQSILPFEQVFDEIAAVADARGHSIINSVHGLCGIHALAPKSLERVFSWISNNVRDRLVSGGYQQRARDGLQKIKQSKYLGPGAVSRLLAHLTPNAQDRLINAGVLERAHRAAETIRRAEIPATLDATAFELRSSESVVKMKAYLASDFFPYSHAKFSQLVQEGAVAELDPSVHEAFLAHSFYEKAT